MIKRYKTLTICAHIEDTWCITARHYYPGIVSHIRYIILELLVQKEKIECQANQHISIRAIFEKGFGEHAWH